MQKDEQGLIRLKTITGEETAPVLTLGEKIVVKGYSESRWQAALDEAGYPKTPAQRRAQQAGPRPEPPPAGTARAGRAHRHDPKGRRLPQAVGPSPQRPPRLEANCPLVLTWIKRSVERPAVTSAS